MLNNLCRYLLFSSLHLFCLLITELFFLLRNPLQALISKVEWMHDQDLISQRTLSHCNSNLLRYGRAVKVSNLPSVHLCRTVDQGTFSTGFLGEYPQSFCFWPPSCVLFQRMDNIKPLNPAAPKAIYNCHWTPQAHELTDFLFGLN